MSIAVLGAGAFGTALAIAIGQHRPVTLWGRDVDVLLTTGQSPRLPGLPLPQAVQVTPNVAEALQADILLFALPMQSLQGFAAGISDGLSGKTLVACCKGIDLQTLKGPSAVLANHWPEATPAVLTGPSFAVDIAAGLPTALTLACPDEARGELAQRQLATPTLRLYRSTDLLGAELGGALKNVVAIACGAAIGLGLGDSARAAVMTRGFSEMTRLARHLGAEAQTLTGLCGMGDLALTCHSETSRNFSHGLSLGRGQSPAPGKTVEGVATARAVTQLAARDGLDLPICDAVHDLTQGQRAPRDILGALLARPLKEE